MPTLLDIKRERGLTFKEIGKALRCSSSTASSIFHGSHVSVYSDEKIQELADVLGITFERCWYAMVESYRQEYHQPDAQPVRFSEGMYRTEVELREKIPDHHWRTEPQVPHPLATVEAISYIDSRPVYDFGESFWQAQREHVYGVMLKWYRENMKWQATPRPFMSRETFFQEIEKAGLEALTWLYKDVGEKLLAGEMPEYQQVVPPGYPALPEEAKKLVQEMLFEFRRRLSGYITRMKEMDL